MEENNRGKFKKKEVIRKMPNNFEAEQAILSAIMIDREICDKVVANLKDEDFYYPAHRIIFKVMRELNSANAPIEMVTIADCLEKENNLNAIGGITYISELANMLTSTANYTHYLNIVSRDSKLRDLINAANSIIDNCSESQSMQDSMNFAEAAMFKVTFSSENKDLVPVSKGLTEAMSKFETMLTSKNLITGLRTGFRCLDNMVKGYQPGQMIVLAARPGCGKTSFAMNIASNIAIKSPEKVVAVFNMEMSLDEIAQRLILSEAGIARDNILNKNSGEVFKKLWEASEKLGKSKLFVDDTSGATPEQIMSKCRRLKQREKRLDFVVVDYLQLLRNATRNPNFQVEIADISRATKIMAKELQVPILILSQTSRDLEKRGGTDPKMSDLRDSGTIEQDADQVYFLTKEEKQENEGFEVVDLHILKQRSGSTGKLKLKWEGSIVRFSEIDDYSALNMPKKATDESQCSTVASTDSSIPQAQPTGADEPTSTFVINDVSAIPNETAETSVATGAGSVAPQTATDIDTSDVDEFKSLPVDETYAAINELAKNENGSVDLKALLGGNVGKIKDINTDEE